MHRMHFIISLVLKASRETTNNICPYAPLARHIFLYGLYLNALCFGGESLYLNALCFGGEGLYKALCVTGGDVSEIYMATLQSPGHRVHPPVAAPEMLRVGAEVWQGIGVIQVQLHLRTVSQDLRQMPIDISFQALVPTLISRF